MFILGFGRTWVYLNIQHQPTLIRFQSSTPSVTCPGAPFYVMPYSSQDVTVQFLESEDFVGLFYAEVVCAHIMLLWCLLLFRFLDFLFLSRRKKCCAHVDFDEVIMSPLSRCVVKCVFSPTRPQMYIRNFCLTTMCPIGSIVKDTRVSACMRMWPRVSIFHPCFHGITVSLTFKCTMRRTWIRCVSVLSCCASARGRVGIHPLFGIWHMGCLSSFSSIVLRAHGLTDRGVYAPCWET
jgi:hypothetical protein